MNILADKTNLIIRAKSACDLRGELAARGKALFAPLKYIDNVALFIQNGKIADFGKWSLKYSSAKSEIHDLGDVILLPGLANAHCHLNLSWTKGQTHFYQSFSTWILSLIALLNKIPALEIQKQALTHAFAELKASGTAYLGDFAGANIQQVYHIAQDFSIQIRYFCEWLGALAPMIDEHRPWPPRVRQAISELANLEANATLAGHAFYSTDAKIIQEAKHFCRQTKRIFALHLAECEEETQALVHATGKLQEIYSKLLLPSDWQWSKLRPLEYAKKLNLLDENTLLIHCVHLDKAEIQSLDEVSICLCPRSNHNLNVGTAKIKDLMQSKALLCLGTDGLSSNSDLDVRQEAIFLREKFDLPLEVLIRLLTINGATALGYNYQSFTIGQNAIWSTFPCTLS